MAEDTQDRLLPSLRLPISGEPLRNLAGRKTALALAMLGAGAAALFICANWTIALVGAVVVLVLSFLESEQFLLLIIFLIPLGSSLAQGALRDVPSAFRSVAIVGFFLGRLWRGRMSVTQLLSSSPSRVSLCLLGAIALPTILGRTSFSAHFLWTGFYIAFFFLVLTWADSRERIQKILKVLMYSTIFTAIFGIFQEVVGGYTSLWLYLYPPGDFFQEWRGRATSFLNSDNSLAAYLNLVIPFALACYVLGRGKWKKLGGWTLGIGIVALLSTQSVGGSIAFVSILILAIFCFSGGGKKRLMLFAGLCALVSLSYLLRGILNPAHPEQTVELDRVGRLMLWRTAFNYFLASPLTGVGWGNFVHLYGFDVPMTPGVLAVPNIYLQFLAETGLVGFVAFFYLVVQTWRQAWSQCRSSVDFLDRALAFGVLGALLSVLVHGLVDYLLEGQIAALFWVLLALLVASGRLQEQQIEL